MLLYMLKFFTITSALRVLDKGMLPLQKDSVAIQFYIDLENDNRTDSCNMVSRPKLCCLHEVDDFDCDIVTAYNDYELVLFPKDRKTMVFVYPTMLQHDQSGYCIFELNYRCARSRRTNSWVKVAFNTKLSKKRPRHKQYVNGRKVSTCSSSDEDSLYDCLPVNCNFKYAGKMPFFDSEARRCVRTPECLTDLDKPFPDLVYEPRSNVCKNLDNPLTLSDIYVISNSIEIVTQKSKDTDLKLIMKSNCTTISQNLQFLKDMLYGKLNLAAMGQCGDFSSNCESAIKSIFSCVISVSLYVLGFVLCVNVIAWIVKKRARGELKNIFNCIKKKVKTELKNVNLKEGTDKETKNKLLKEVIVTNLPLELRQSIVNMCLEYESKKRYRADDVRRQFSWKGSDTDTSTTSDFDDEEKRKLMK